MDFSALTKLCTCSGAQICPFCQMLTVAAAVLLGVFLGYRIGKRGKKPPEK